VSVEFPSGVDANWPVLHQEKIQISGLRSPRNSGHSLVFASRCQNKVASGDEEASGHER